MASPSLQTTANIPLTTPPSSQNVVAGQTGYHEVTAAVPQPTTPATPVSPPDTERPRKRRRVLNRITRPEPGSLYDILHENQGESLFTIPICWTDQHPKALGVQWIHRDAICHPVPDFNSMSSKYPPRPTRIATELSNDLTIILSPDVQSRLGYPAIKKVMSTFFPATLSQPRTGADLELRFGDRILKRAVRAPVLWKQHDSASRSFDSASTKVESSNGWIPSSSREAFGSQTAEWSRDSFQSASTQPVLVYINREGLQIVRRGLYRVAPGPVNGDHRNTPVTNLQGLRSKRLTPKDPDHDPYIIAVMIAVAQSQCYPPSSRSSSKSSSQKSSQGSQRGYQTYSPQPNFRDVPVTIITQDYNEAEFVIQSAVVTAALLKRFAFPSKAFRAVDSLSGDLDVEVTKVPVWPVLGLKERLAKALGPELAGDLACSDISDEDIETWETEQERDFRIGNLKRKRGPLYGALNQSLEVSNDGEEPPSSGSGLGITVASPPLSPRTPKRTRTQSHTQLEVC